MRHTILYAAAAAAAAVAVAAAAATPAPAPAAAAAPAGAHDHRLLAAVLAPPPAVPSPRRTIITEQLFAERTPEPLALPRVAVERSMPLDLLDGQRGWVHRTGGLALPALAYGDARIYASAGYL